MNGLSSLKQPIESWDKLGAAAPQWMFAQRSRSSWANTSTTQRRCFVRA